MTHADFNDLETRDYVFKIGDRGKGIQARYDENTDALIFPRAAFDYVCKLLNEALSQEPCDDTVSIRKDVLKCRVGKLVAYNVEWLKKHWQMEMDIVCGVKPCDDAVSRDAVCDYIAEFVNNEYSTQSECDMVELMIKGIKHLPPVSTTKNIVNHGTMNITL